MKKFNQLFVLLALLPYLAVNAQGLKVQKTFPINGAGGYDYITVDSVSDNLYVSHGTQVNILNKTTGDSIGVISSDKDIHGIAIAHEFAKGYITNGGANSVLIFDLKTNKILGSAPTGMFADGVFYDDFSKKIISCNGRSKNMTVIDPVTDQSIATIQLTGWPETATSDGAGKIYVNNSEKSEIDVIDATTYKIISTWPIKPGKDNSGLAIDRQTMRLFIGCGNKLLTVMDATNGKVITTVPIGDESDAICFDKKLKTIYSSNGEGTLTVIREESANKFKVEQTLTTQKGARTIAVDQITHTLYLPVGQFAPKKPGTFRPSVIAGTFKVLVVGK